jgi:hypothetical protein
MRRLLALALPAALLLGAPAAATAKRVTAAKVCGADGCETIAAPGTSLLEGGPPAQGPAAREPFVRMQFRIGVPGHSEPVHMLFLPRSGLVLADDGQTWMHPVALDALRTIADRVTALPAGALPASAPLAPRPSPPQPRVDGGSGVPWWPAVAAAVVLAAGAVLARRRRAAPAAGAAGATG